MIHKASALNARQRLGPRQARVTTAGNMLAGPRHGPRHPKSTGELYSWPPHQTRQHSHPTEVALLSTGHFREGLFAHPSQFLPAKRCSILDLLRLPLRNFGLARVPPAATGAACCFWMQVDQARPGQNGMRLHRMESILNTWCSPCKRLAVHILLSCST